MLGLRLFENEFKAEKSLFTNADCSQFKENKAFVIFEANQEPNFIDLFEDNMLEEVDSSGILELKEPAEFMLDQINKKKA